MSDTALRKQIEELMHAQRVNDSMFEEGSEKWETNRVALIDQYEALCQEVAREAEKRGWDNCALHTATEYMMLSAKDFREKMANTRSELTQKPAEETEGQPETWLYECEVDGEKFEGRPYMVMKICPEHKAEFEKWRKENKRV